MFDLYEFLMMDSGINVCTAAVDFRITGRIENESELSPDEEEHKAENHNGYQYQHDVKENSAQPGRPPLFPIAHLGTFGHAHLILMLEVMRKFPGGGVAILGIAFERAVNDFL